MIGCINKRERREGKVKSMRVKEKDIILKNSLKCKIRTPESKDSKIFIDHLMKILSETDFMLTYPEEFTMTLEEEGKMLEETADSENKAMITAFINGIVAGNVSVYPIRDREKVSHRASIGIGVVQKFWGLEIAKHLITMALDTARKMGYSQIELGVFKDNHKAIKLYEEFAFVKCGEVPNAFKLKDGTYRDEILMYRNL